MLTACWLEQCSNAARLLPSLNGTQGPQEGAVETSSMLLPCTEHLPRQDHSATMHARPGSEERAQFGGPGVRLAHAQACRHALQIFLHAGSSAVLLSWDTTN